MSPFPNYPLNERFRTLEDAQKYIEKPDWSLCIPTYIAEDTPHGKKIRINPEYSEAPYEQKVLFGKVGAMYRT